MPETKKLLIIVMFFSLGATGFCISFFGWLTSFFILLMNLSTLAFWFIVYSYIRKQGLLSFLPPGLQKVMIDVSFFDILVNVFIHRRLSKMIVALFRPFLKAESPEEVKAILKEEALLSSRVYKGLFRKGIMNNMSNKAKAVMLP